MNRLQNLDPRHDVFITLNPAKYPRNIIDDVWYAHGVHFNDAELDQLANQLATEKARAGLDSEAQSQESALRERYGGPEVLAVREVDLPGQVAYFQVA